MHGNLEERIKAISPVDDQSLRARLWDILQLIAGACGVVILTSGFAPHCGLVAADVLSSRVAG